MLLFRAQISGACVISGLYCEGALVLANVGDCQALYHGQVKSSPGAAVTAQTVRGVNFDFDPQIEAALLCSALPFCSLTEGVFFRVEMCVCVFFFRSCLFWRKFCTYGILLL